MRISAVLFFLFFVQFILAQTADLKVVITDIKEIKGNIFIGVFDNAIDFKNKEKPVAASKVNVTDTKITYVFRGLDCRRYAIAVFHDQNSNGILDKKKLGIPTEGVGFSSKVASKLHQPIYPEASFVLQNDTTVCIKIYYTGTKEQ